MKKYLYLAFAVLFLYLFSVGCQKAELPVAPTQTNEQTNLIDGNQPSDDFPQIPPELIVAQEAKIAELTAKFVKIDGGIDKGKGSRKIDYSHGTNESHFYPRIGEIWPFRSWDYDYNNGTCQSQVVYITFWQWAGRYDTPYNIIIPMSQETFNALYKVTQGGVEYSFVTQDAVTGMTGMKVDVSNLDWVDTPQYGVHVLSCGFIYLAHNAYRSEDFLPEFEPTYIGIDEPGYSWTVGPYYTFAYDEPIYNLTGIAFYDLNENGTKEEGEAGIEGAEVSLSIGATATTDANGAYAFGELTNGDYIVTIADFNGRTHTTEVAVNVTIDGANCSTDFGFAGYSINGKVFYDLNGSGAQDAGEPAINGQAISLSGGGSTSSSADGSYSFNGLLPGDYIATMSAISGFSSNELHHAASICNADVTANFSFSIDINWFNRQRVSGVQGSGWWKENINKAIRGQRNGAQISVGALEALRSTLSTFAYPVLNYANLTDAYTALAYSGGNAASKAVMHFTASEYNYANGSLVNSNAQASWALMVWGEYVVTNSGNYSSSYLNAVKDLFEHFNGGELEVPDPLR